MAIKNPVGKKKSLTRTALNDCIAYFKEYKSTKNEIG